MKLSSVGICRNGISMNFGAQLFLIGKVTEEKKAEFPMISRMVVPFCSPVISRDFPSFLHLGLVKEMDQLRPASFDNGSSASGGS